MYSLRLAPVTPRHSNSSSMINAFLFSAISVGLVLLFLTPLVVTEWTVSPFIFGKAIYARALILMLVALWIVLRVDRQR